MLLHFLILKKFPYIYLINFFAIAFYLYKTKVTSFIKNTFFYNYYFAILLIFNLKYTILNFSVFNFLIFVILSITYLASLYQIKNLIMQNIPISINNNLIPKQLLTIKKNKVTELISLIENTDIPSIVINQKIGSGKTLFINGSFI